MFSKNFQEIHLLSKMFLKVYFLHCSVIKVPVVTDLRQQLIQFITLFSVCQLFFYFLSTLFADILKNITFFQVCQHFLRVVYFFSEINGEGGI